MDNTKILMHEFDEKKIKIAVGTAFCLITFIFHGRISKAIGQKCQARPEA